MAPLADLDKTCANSTPYRHTERVGRGSEHSVAIE
jgi:hypothetical protein